MNRCAFSCFSMLFRCLLLLVMGAALGCGKGDGGVKDSVTGKVTLGGKPVSGEVIFIGSGKKEVRAIIATDGTYVIPNPAPGDYQVLVKSMGKVASPKDLMKGMQAPSGTGGSLPPPKYAKLGNGLGFTVTAGQQKKDFELTP